jgi:hypothetical protein
MAALDTPHLAARRHVVLVGDSVTMQLCAWLACRNMTEKPHLHEWTDRVFNSSSLVRKLAKRATVDTLVFMFGAHYLQGATMNETGAAAAAYMQLVPWMLGFLRSWVAARPGRIGVFASPPTQHWRDGGYSKVAYDSCVARATTRPPADGRELCGGRRVAASFFLPLSTTIARLVATASEQSASTPSGRVALHYLPLTELTMGNGPSAALRHPGWARSRRGTLDGRKETCDCTHFCYTPRAWDGVMQALDGLMDDGMKRPARVHSTHCG